MNGLELKNLKTQLELSNDINRMDGMIIHNVQMEASSLFRKIIEPKMFMDKKQKTVELTVEEFTEIRLLLARLSNDDGFKQLNTVIKSNYIDPKNEMRRILNMLR